MVSILNGLSALGTGVSAFAGSAALEMQKSQLANQSAILADQLATTRETKLQGQQQTYQTGENVASREATATNLAAQIAAENTRTQAQIAATASNTQKTIEAEAERQRVGFTAPTELEKTFRFLGLNPDGSPKTDANAPSPTPSPSPTAPSPTAPSSSTPIASTGTTTGQTADASGTTGAPMPDTGAAGVTTPGAVTPPKPSPLDNPLVRKALGQPALGSPEASRYAIAQDVNSDPAFKYKTAGQKAAEVELRVAVAEGKMTDPASREAMAQGIASYQIAPLSGFSLTKPGGPETMARAIILNPDYQESRYPEVNKAMSAFGSGKQGDIIRANNVGVQHLDVIDQAAAALANGNIGALNSLKNAFQQQFGAPAPTTFDGLKQIVGTEIEKAVAGGIGSSADRDRLQAALDRARSPAQLQAMTDGFRSLMIGQLSGLKTQYEEATGFKSGPFAFENKLAPATVARLGGGGGTAPAVALPPDRTATAPQTVYTDSGPVDLPAAPAPRAPAVTPNVIRYDAQGNRVSP